jgi:hypothetical protein
MFAMLAGTVVRPARAVITTLPAGSFSETLYRPAPTGADDTLSILFAAAAETFRPALPALENDFMCRFLLSQIRSAPSPCNAQAGIRRYFSIAMFVKN